MRDLSAALVELEQRVAQGDDEGALLVLLRIWEHHRAPAVAELAQTLSQRLASRRLPPQTHDAWCHLARACDPLSVTALMEAPWKHERSKALRRKLEILQRFPPDPRLAAFGEAIRAHVQGRAGIMSLLGEVERLVALHGPGRDRSEGELDVRVRAVHERLGPTLEEQLLNAVFESPHQDGPRWVFVDWLLSIGDPLAPYLAATLRTGGVLRDLPPQMRWWWSRRLGLEELHNCLEFRRGFPSRIAVSHRPREPLGGGWATVEQLDLFEPAVEWAPLLRGLRALSGLGLRFVGDPEPWMEVARPHLAALPLQTLDLPQSAWSAGLLREGWPKLRAMRWHEVRSEVRLDEQALGPLPRPLELELIFPPNLGDWLGRLWHAATSSSPSLVRINARSYALRAALRRDETGGFSVLRLEGVEPDSLEVVKKQLRGLRSDAPRQIELVGTPDPAAQAQLLRALTPLTPAELSFRVSP
jgi:uncharacterized protein (TIGR02996 family)